MLKRNFFSTFKHIKWCFCLKSHYSSQFFILHFTIAYNIYSAIIAWLSHRLRIFSDFNIKVCFCQFLNNGFHLSFFLKIVLIC